ncbi:phage portal protein [Kaistia dalseonensis]|uniref:Lambda family phage portal protein n=1 Tax=Kaistia dalseonensis TaxID=410840 RepID=A0ABU0HC20_9HYPH|nr:phage portal protein [Kaistia dalseonensis]MCX5496443.1 phage portal protein [Kaistia dalseonensis]MDQ0439064.1 lambda family phage portal protein [Kaistia dalseonensis]
MQAANWIDRAIGYVAPAAALRRVQARTQIARIARTRALYEAASAGRRTHGWRSVGTDANAETRIAAAKLRDVSRDMVRNNPFAFRTKSVIANNVVGAGIIPAVKAARQQRADKIKELLDQHFDSTDIDADGRLNLYGLQWLAMATIVESGEVLIRKRIRRPEDGLALPFQIQILEPDFLDSSVDGALSNGNFAVQGVEFDQRGKRVAYYLFDEHPGATIVGSRSSFKGKRVSADFVLHVCRVDRPGQVRGVSWFAPVILRMRDFADYTDAQLMRQKIAACFAAFITGSSFDDGLDDDQDTRSSGGYPLETLEPGIIERLGEGETVTFASPPTTQDFAPYASVTLHEIAAGLGIPYEVLTGDLSGVNFSSGRMGWLEFARAIDTYRWNMLIPQMMGPLGRWTAEAAAVVTGSSEPFRMVWTPPRREMIDQSTEIKSAVSKIRAGLNSRSDEVRMLGYDPEKVDAEIAADNERADRMGLVLDSDPRRNNAQGQAQPEPSLAA